LAEVLRLKALRAFIRRLTKDPYFWLLRKIRWNILNQYERLSEIQQQSKNYKISKESDYKIEQPRKRIYDWIREIKHQAIDFNPYADVLARPKLDWKQKALQFDSDFQPQFPVYYNPSLINYYVIRLQDYYSYLASVQVCTPLSRSISYINQECYHATASIFDKDKNKIDWEDIRKDKLLDFFDDSDVSLVWKNFVSLVNTYYFCCGNVYIVPDGPLRGGGYEKFTVLPPQYVTIELGMDGEPQFYRYRPGCGATLSVGQTLNGQSVAEDRRDLGVYTELIILPKDIIHIKRYHNSLLPIYGIGVVEAAEPLFQRYLQHNRLQEHYIDNAFISSGWLESDADANGVMLNSDDAKKWTQEINAEYVGKNNAGKLFVAPTGFKFHETTIPSVEQLEIQKRNIDIEIFTLFNMPCSFWAIDGKDLPRYGNLEAQTQVFRETVLKEILDVHTIIGNKILEMQRVENKYTFSYSNAQSYQASQQLTKDWMAGMLKRDEARKFVGLEPVGGEDGDSFYVRETAVAKDEADLKAEEAGADNKFDVPGEQDKVLPQTDKHKPQDSAQTLQKKKSCAVYRSREKSWRDTNAGGWISKPEREVWKRREIPGNKERIVKDLHRLQTATKERHSGKLYHPIKKFLHEQLGRIMKAVEEKKGEYESLVKRHGGVKEKVKDPKNEDIKKFQQDLFKLDEENKLLKPIISSAYKSTGPDVVENIASTFTISVKPEEIHAITQKISLVGDSRAPMVNESTNASLEGFIRDSVDNNYSWGELANNIYHGYAGNVTDYVDKNGQVYRSIDDSQSLHDRAELIAQTETQKACTEASKAYYQGSESIKTFQIYGCSEPPDNEWCGKTGILPDELDDIDLHPRCVGVLVPDEFDENFGAD
jgi:phage portal protein BeeE